MLWYSLVHVFYNILTLKFSVQLICAVFGTNFKLPKIFYFPQQTLCDNTPDLLFLKFQLFSNQLKKYHWQTKKHNIKYI